MIGVPKRPLPTDIDAVVVALKSRTNPVDDAIQEFVGALRWLQQTGCLQFYFKYCSTFDFTPRGNIGPVAEALMDALGTDFTIACPAFPANHRTIYKGHLFVGDVLLSDSSMRNHPLTPMTDPNLVHVLQAQVGRKVGLIDYATVSSGAMAIHDRIEALRGDDYGFAIVDALSDRDLREIGVACADLPLVTAGSGLAVGLTENFSRKNLLRCDVAADTLPGTGGLRAVIAGSCSAATQQQVALMRDHHPAFHVDPVELSGPGDLVAAALDWAASRVRSEPILVYATARPDEVRAAQARLGVQKAGRAGRNGTP